MERKLNTSLRAATWITLSAIFLAVAGCRDKGTSLADVLPESPGINVLIISFDALRYDRLGLYGSKLGLTPNMDRFASQALVFDNAYVAGQATPSSFAAAFTGQHPFRAFRGWSLAETQTLAKVFQAGGYHTGGFFNNQYLSPDRNYHQGFDQYQVTVNQTDEEPLNAVRQFLTDNAERKFFAWVHFINPHSAYDYREMAKQFYDASYEGEYKESSGARIQRYDLSRMSEEDLDRIGQLYNGEVHFADHRFGQVIDHLQALGLSDRTLVVLTTDHGEAYREHDSLGHDKLYEEVIRVPLVIRHPEADGPHRVQVPVINTDLLPTLGDIAALEYVPELMDGVSLREPFDHERPLLFTQMTNPGRHSMAMRQGDFKLLIWCVKRKGPTEELYDLSSDPGELTNLIAEPGYGERADAMFDTWQEMLGQHPCTTIDRAVAGATMEDRLDEEAMEKLRSLGYIQ